ncbi:cytochrome P450 [Streptomyces mobaraensis NBRC 13819 = DSM 40847]|uniref:Cytochrome P450 n=1 Tax=Streptomyces mobaraensis (strain ATCC 29032 / DSM 40847 / JCM 4168 / NBRC 13819 / NCIMB 11159 / IPCR 16-22) TaxID=1223523 RepID=M3CDU2_STRM1|nr:cytochrome P450 [Streptomyces mobaraensis]EMF02181.1 cytochrome P450 [Streptomyces mobaraensis NBRC 13819 = DSM 40847]QTT76644.1 cytochrome P450 [Streptomyces mobaraensis NBRC 13819 = DSM 40847]
MLVSSPEGRVRAVPLHRVVAQVVANGPLGLMEETGRQGQGDVVRLGLGAFRPLLVTHPEHLRHVLRDAAENYVRGTAMWNALGRLTGQGIAGEGPGWLASRNALRKAMSATYLQRVGATVADAVEEAVEALAGRAERGPVDAVAEMTRLVHRVINPVFFASRIDAAQCDRLGEEVAGALGSLLWRMAMPFVPYWVPLPGDRAFARATSVIKDILLPVIERARRAENDGPDLMSALLRARDAHGRPLGDEHVRQDIVALFVAGSESSALTLTWTWVVLSRHPEIAARVRREADEVLAGGPPRFEHARRLVYTQRVLAEVMRLYSMAWAVPRVARRDDRLGRVPVPAGTTLVVSPYLTHRLADFWPDPLRFDPDRFERSAVRARHPLAYLPFGDGAHQCVGQGFFTLEATLVLAAVLSRYEVRVLGDPRPRLAVALPPDRPVGLALTRRTR